MRKSILLCFLLLVVTGVLSVLDKAGSKLERRSQTKHDDVEASTLSLTDEPPPLGNELSEVHQVLAIMEEAWRNLTHVEIEKVSGNYFLGDDEILSFLSRAKLDSAWDADPGSWSRFLRSHPWIKDASVSFSIYPLRAQIEITEIEPWLVWRSQEKSWLLSRKMEIVESLDEVRDPEVVVELSALPRVSVIGEDKTLLRRGLEMIRDLELAGRLPFDVFQYLVLPGEIAVEPLHPDTASLIRLSVHDLDEARTKLEQLRTVIQDLHSRSEIAREIDLRVRGQVIVRRFDNDQRQSTPRIKGNGKAQ